MTSMSAWDALPSWYQAEALAYYQAEHDMQRYERMNPPKQEKA